MWASRSELIEKIRLEERGIRALVREPAGFAGPLVSICKRSSNCLRTTGSLKDSWPGVVAWIKQECPSA